MAMVEKNGQMAHTTRENTIKPRNTATVYSNGLMVPNLSASGRTIKCTERENSFGVMAVSTLGSIVTIRSLAKVSILGPMVESIGVASRVANSTVKEFTRNHLVNKCMVFGIKEKESRNSTRKKSMITTLRLSLNSQSLRLQPSTDKLTLRNRIEFN